jgi:hypothetical protein
MKGARGLPPSQHIGGRRNRELKAGDIASPVQITSGKRTKITIRYAVLWSTLYEKASALSGRPRCMCFAITPRYAPTSCRPGQEIGCSGSGHSTIPRWCRRGRSAQRPTPFESGDTGSSHSGRAARSRSQSGPLTVKRGSVFGTAVESARCRFRPNRSAGERSGSQLR